MADQEKPKGPAAPLNLTPAALLAEVGTLGHQCRHIALRRFGFEQRVVDDRGDIAAAVRLRH